MTRLEKIQYAIDKGFTYNSETGKIYGIRGKEIMGRDKDGYVSIGLNKNYHNLLGHQFAWYVTNNEIVECLDHINKDKSDNRICNLRSITNQENQFNQKAKGYSFNKRINKYFAQIHLNYKNIHLGYFDDENDARQAYLDAKEIYHII